MHKIALRAEYLDRRRDLPAQTVKKASEEWTQRFLAQANLLRGHYIGGYYPTQGEIDVLPLLAHLTKEGFITALPVTPAVKQSLLFRRWEPGAALKTGTFSIKEPLPAAPVVVPEVLIVPLLAFDTKGHRLGYGGGFYDRSLALLQAPAIGIAYAGQEVPSLPHEAHDRTLDMILTENGLRRFS